MDIIAPLSDGRLTLRPASLTDVDAFFDYHRQPESQTYLRRTIVTVEDARAFIAERVSKPGTLMCVIEIDGRMIGDIGCRRFRPESLGPEPGVWDCSLGYAVDRRRWGHGIASAAVALLVPVVHQRIGIRRVVAKAFADNQASIRVLLKNGFELQGTERAAVRGRDGRWLDDCTLVHRL